MNRPLRLFWIPRRTSRAAAIWLAAASLIAGVAYAQGTYTAASCNYSDVNAVVNGPTHTAQNGDTIRIPSGTCTWNSSLTPPSGVAFTLIGSGSPNTSPSTFGAGALSTTIVDNAGSGAPMINVTGLTPGNGVMRISSLDIEPTSTSLVSPINVSGTCNSSTCPTARIDNIGFGLTTPWKEGNVGAQAVGMIRWDNTFGVVDHNTMPSGNYGALIEPQNSSWQGVGTNGDNSWAQPDSFGSANQVVIENNLLYNTYNLVDTELGAYGGAIGGARYTFRFNVVHAGANAFDTVSGHGLDTDGRPQGMRQVEAYNNNIDVTGGSGNTAVASFRSGGTGLVFDNYVSANYAANGGYFNVLVDMNAFRTVYTATAGWGACGGSSPYDTNDGTVYFTGTVSASGGSLTGTFSGTSWSTNQWAPSGAPYSVYDTTQGWWGEIQSNTSNSLTVMPTISEQSPYGFNNGDTVKIQRATVCADQPGRGQGTYVSGTPASAAGPLNQALDPIYEWNDTANGNVNGLVSTDTGRIIANRDYYNESMNQGAQTSQSSPFNGSSGTGHGTLANRPTSCTTGVGYWATDQGNWNQSGLSGTGTGDGYGGQGQLFKCTSTNTWTLAYTPYTYPHPLVSGATQSATPQPPTNLTVSAQ
jgi:hypothetical protein